MSDSEVKKRHKIINNKLQDNFLCVPPYDLVNNYWFNELYQKLISDDESYINFVTEMILKPHVRAFQNVYRYIES